MRGPPVKSVDQATQSHSRTSNPLVHFPVCTRLYQSDDSIVLIGFSGAGKKTLGIIASVALKRRYIDFETFFQQREGLQLCDYISSHGVAKYREIEYQITSDLLSTHQKGCVITGLTVTASRIQRQLLQGFAKSNPVILIRRQVDDIKSFMNLSEDKFHRLYNIGVSLFESCSNFDFYNLTQTTGVSTSQVQPETLKLKHAERYFIRFLGRVFGHPPALLQSNKPLDRTYTHSLQIPIAWMKFRRYEELECGTDAITLIVDQRDRDISNIQSYICEQLAILRRNSRSPLVLDIKLQSVADADEYCRFIEMGLRNVPDFVTLDLSLERDKLELLSARRGHIRIIGTHHLKSAWSEDETVQTIVALQKFALHLSCSAILVSSSSTSVIDDLNCLRIVKEANERHAIPLIGYNIGGSARISQLFAPVMSPVPLSSAGEGGTNLREAHAVLFASGLLQRKRFTMIGQSVNYSLSPAMHNAGYAACGLPHIYNCFQTDDFNQIHQLLQESEHGGVIISMPFKRDILPLLDEWGPEVQDIGAANTVIIQQAPGDARRKFKGYNTDYLGQKECIDRALSPANAVTSSTTALIIGAGGMARAGIYACHKLGVRQVCVYNRTAQRATELAEYYNRWSTLDQTRKLEVTVLDNPDQPWPTQLRQPTIIVACIPAHSVAGRPASEFDIPEQWLQSRTGGVFVDLAYKPIVTRLLRQMQQLSSRGWSTVNGLSVLLEQGVIQYEILTGRPAPVHDMRRAIQLQVENYPESLS